MILLEKLKILTPLQKLTKNVGVLGKLIIAKGLKKLPKVQLIAQSGHTATNDDDIWDGSTVAQTWLLAVQPSVKKTTSGALYKKLKIL